MSSYLGKRRYGANRPMTSRYGYKRSQRSLSYNRGPGRAGYKPAFFAMAKYGQRELGYVDVATTPYPLDNTGSVTLLNTIAQGASVNQRVGKKVQLKGIQARGVSFNNTGASFNDFAYMIVWDKRPTGALPAVTDILTAALPTAMNNDANAGRFSILKRVDGVMIGNSSFTGAVANALTDSSALDQDWYLDLKGRETVYKAAATGAIGDIEQGALYLVTVGSNAAGATAASLYQTFRLRFLDV